MQVKSIDDFMRETLRPLTARLVLVNRPDVAVRIFECEFAPAPGLIDGVAREGEHRTFVDTALVEFVDVVDAKLEVDANSWLVRDEIGGVLVLRVDHEREGADAKNRQGNRPVVLGFMQLNDLGADDFVIELVRPDDIIHIKKNAGNLSRHPTSPATESRVVQAGGYTGGAI